MIYEITKLNLHDMILGFTHVGTRAEMIDVVAEYSKGPQAIKITVKKWKNSFMPKNKKK